MYQLFSGCVQWKTILNTTRIKDGLNPLQGSGFYDKSVANIRTEHNNDKKICSFNILVLSQ